MDETNKTNILEKQKEVLSLVKQQIDEVLNPSKSSYDSSLTQHDIFNSVGIREEQYYSALAVSPGSNYELSFKKTCMPELRLRKVFPATLFVETDLTDKTRT